MGDAVERAGGIDAQVVSSGILSLFTAGGASGDHVIPAMADVLKEGEIEVGIAHGIDENVFIGSVPCVPCVPCVPLVPTGWMIWDAWDRWDGLKKMFFMRWRIG